MSAQNISYHRFWKGLVETGKHLVIKELQTYPISTPAVVDDVQSWVRRAAAELKLWNELHGHTKTKEVAESIKQLRDLPRAMRTAQKPDDILWKLTSVSLLRFRPFRRTMLWDLFSNLLLPREYIEERIEKTEASLTSGETAFAAFAASFSSGNEDGMVVGDCRENLRGTYFLIDRAIGLRSNVVVPMRSVKNETTDDAPGPILAMVVVSLPFANAFDPDFSQRLRRELCHYEVNVELMWAYDQLVEQAETEEKPYLKGEIRSIIDDLTPDARTTEGHAVLPGCAVLIGEAAGSTEMAAAVELNALHLRASPRHESLFAQSELELEAYGISDRCVSLDSFIDLGGSHEYHLMVQLRNEQLPVAESPPEATRIFKTIGDTISKSFVSGGKACRAHRQHETQRALFGYLLDYLVTGAEHHRRKFEQDLLYGRSRMSGAFNFGQLKCSLDLLNKWAYVQRSNWKYLSLCIEKPVFTLEYPQESLTYLSGFEVDLFATHAPFLLSDPNPPAAHHQTRNAALELGGPRRFIAWSRALNALFQTIPSSTQIQKFRVERFAILDESNSSEFICYLPSMLLPDGATIGISRDGKATSVSIRSSGNEWAIRSKWRREPGLLPLCTACVPSFTRGSDSGLENGSKLTPIRLSGLTSEKAIFFDLRRMHGATKKRNWRFDPAIDPSLKPLAKMVSGLAPRFPEWFASMDCLAIVPMPFDDALEIPTFSRWCQGSGRRHLLVAGILRQSAEQDVGAEWDIEVMNHQSDDPFIERFKVLLATMQRRQSGRRRVEALRQTQFVFTHLSHDICSHENIATLQKVLKKQGHLLKPKHVLEKNELHGAELIVDDLKQLQLLARGIKANTLPLGLSLNEITSYVGPAASRAIDHAARKLSLVSATDVSREDLKRILNITPMASQDQKHAEYHLVLVLLDNLIRNALEGAWNYNQQLKKNRGRVCIQHRPKDNSLVIANDAQPGRWKRIQQLYLDENTSSTGITIIRMVADFLKLTYAVQIISDTRGEIHLIA